MAISIIAMLFTRGYRQYFSTIVGPSWDQPWIGWPPSGVSHIAGRSAGPRGFRHGFSRHFWFSSKTDGGFHPSHGGIVFPSSFHWAHHSKGHLLAGGFLGISLPSSMSQGSTGKPRVKQMTTSFGVAGWLSGPGGPLVMTNSLRTGKSPCY